MAGSEQNGYVDPITGTNPFMMIGGQFVRALGAYAYAQFMPTPDLPVYHSASANRIYQESQYVTYQTSFRDADIARKTEALARNAEKLGIDPTIIREHKGWLSMLLRADTPEIRAKIRKELGTLGDGLLKIFDTATANEPGMERVYSGLADTYGSAKGNEMAAYAANYAANQFKHEELSPEGYRQTSAGTLSATLAELQKFGYNFQVSTGQNLKDTKSYNEAYRQAFESNPTAQIEAWDAYMEEQIAAAPEEEKKALKFIRDAGLDGELNQKSMPKYVGENAAFKNEQELQDRQKAIKSNLLPYIQANTAQVQKNTILKQLKSGKDNKYTAAFKDYLKNNKIEITPLADNASEDDRKKHDKKMEEAQNQFINAIQEDMLKTEDQEFGELYAEGTALGELQKVEKEAEKQIEPQTAAVKKELARLKHESHIRHAVGQAAWDQLSSEEQQQYLDMAGSLEGAQTMLGNAQMNKYEHENYSHLEFSKAASGVQRLRAAAAQANISDNMVSQYASFIGSTIQNKGLTGMTTRASIEWQAGAKAQGIELSEEQRLESAQRSARIADSAESANLAMFLNQAIDPESELGQLQQAIKNNNLTPEQFNKFKEYQKDQGKFLEDIAKATGKNRGELTEEARWVKSNWNMQTAEVQTNGINLLGKTAYAVQNETVVTEGALKRNITDEEVKWFGVNKDGPIKNDTEFRSMVKNVVENAGMNITDMVIGLADERDIADLEKFNPAAAQYAKERSELRETLKAEIAEEHPELDDGELNTAVDAQMGRYEIQTSMNSVFQGEDKAWKQGRDDRVDTSAKTKNDETRSVSEEITNTARENEKNATVLKNNGDKDLINMVEEATGKNLKEGREWFDSMMKSFMDTVKGFIGIGTENQGQDTTNTLSQAILGMFENPKFVEGVGKGLGDAFRLAYLQQIANTAQG